MKAGAFQIQFGCKKKKCDSGCNFFMDTPQTHECKGKGFVDRLDELFERGKNACDFHC